MAVQEELGVGEGDLIQGRLGSGEGERAEEGESYNSI